MTHRDGTNAAYPPPAVVAWQDRVAELIAAERELGIAVKIQDRPKWLPDWLWSRIIARVVYLEIDL